MAHTPRRMSPDEPVMDSDDSHVYGPEKSATGVYSRSSAGQDITSAFLDEASEPHRRIGPVLALLVQVAVIVFLIVTIAVPVVILQVGAMSVPANAAYVLGTTLLASIIAAYTLGQIRVLWLEDVLAVYADQFKESERFDAHTNIQRIQQARTLLGIGAWRHWLQFPQLTICTAVMAAMAGAIVAGVTPSPFQSPKLSVGAMDLGRDPSIRGCWNYTDTPQDEYLAMPTLNGSFLVPTYLHNGLGEQACLTDRMFTTLSVDSLPAAYLYRTASALVNSSALGTPINYIHTAGDTYFDNRARRGDDAVPFENLLAWSSCAPNVVSNPVQCKTAPNGTITRLSNGSISLSADSCQYTANVPSANERGQRRSTVGHVCPTGPGQARLLLGAFDDSASELNMLMGEPEDWNGTSFAITCTVDVWPSIGSREIEWSRLTDPSVAFYDPFVVAAKDNNTAQASCELPWVWENNYFDEGLPSEAPKLADLRTDGTLFAPLAALQVLLDENQATDGYPYTLYSMAGLTSNQIRVRGRPNAPYAFPQSKTAVEDSLGVVVAAALSLEWSTVQLAQDSKSLLAKQQRWVGFNGTMFQQGQRVGSGMWWTVAYLLPEVFAIVVIVTFQIRARRRWRLASRAQHQRGLH